MRWKLLKKTAVFIMIITVVSKIIGFGREMALANFFGASNISDAYIIAFTIPTIIFSFFGQAISTGYIPIYNNISNNYSEDESVKFTGSLICNMLLLSTFVVVVCLIFSVQIVKIFAIGFDQSTTELAVEFTRISLFGIFFTIAVTVMIPFLQLRKRFIIASATGIPMNIVLIVFMIIAKQTNVILLGYGILFSSVFQLIFIFPFAFAEGLRFKLNKSFFDENIMSLLKLGIPVFLGVAVNDINKLIDRTIASQMTSGAISSLNYASQISYFVQGIVVMSIMTVIYPEISRMVEIKDMTGVKNKLVSSLEYVLLIVIPASFGIVALAEPIVIFLFGRGKFDVLAIAMTSGALLYYSIGLPFVALREVLSRPFYALHDTRTPVINASIGVVVNILLNVILSKLLGMNGLALATSISALITALLMGVTLKKRIGEYEQFKLLIVCIKIVIASAIMAIFSRFMYYYITKYIPSAISLMLSIFISFLLYIILLFLFKNEKINEIKLLLNKKN